MENIVTVIFKVESEVYQALSELKRNLINGNYTIYQVGLVKKVNDKIIVIDGVDTGETTLDDTIAGGLLGGLFGVLGGPLEILLGGSVGSLIGSSIDDDDMDKSISLIENVSNNLGEGNVSIIMLVQENSGDAVELNFSKYKVKIIRKDAVIVLDEIEVVKKIEEEMKKEAKKKLRETKKLENKQKIEEKRKAMKADFEAFKQKKLSK